MTGLTFMGFVALLLLGFGLVVSLLGWVVLLIAAFRRHVGWGVANLLVPGAVIVFAVMHWVEARRGFLLQVMGGLVLAVGALAANDGGSFQLVRTLSTGEAERPADAEAVLKAKVMELRVAEEELAALQAKLNADYEALKSRRANLGKDSTVLAVFNQDAAAYTTAKTELSVKAGRVAQLRADEVRLTDQVFLKARELAKSRPHPVTRQEPEPVRAATPKPISVASGDVVMYTTSRCPACIRAKQYFARRGVPYREINVEAAGEGRAEFDKLGGRSVPLIVVKGRQMAGFNQTELDKLL